MGNEAGQSGEPENPPRSGADFLGSGLIHPIILLCNPMALWRELSSTAHIQIGGIQEIRDGDEGQALRQAHDAA